MNHFHEMAGSIGAAMGNAGARIGLGGNGLKNRPDKLIGFRRSSRHDGRPKPGSFFAARNPRPEEIKTILRQIRLAPLRVFKPGISAVNNNVALGEQGLQHLNGVIHRVSGFKHDHDLPRSFQSLDEFFQSSRADEFFSLIFFHKRGDPVTSQIANRHRKTMVLDVHR